MNQKIASLLTFLLLTSAIDSHARLETEEQRAVMTEILEALPNTGGGYTIEDALDRANFTMLGRTIFFNSRFPDWVIKLATPRERLANAVVIQRLITAKRLSGTAMVPSKYVIQARNFANAPILIARKVEMSQCKDEVRAFYNSLTIEKQAEIAFIILKTGINDIDAEENMPKVGSKVGFIDTGARIVTFKERLVPYAAFINKLAPDRQARFYTIDAAASEADAARLIGALETPGALLTTWAGAQSRAMGAAE